MQDTNLLHEMRPFLLPHRLCLPPKGTGRVSFLFFLRVSDGLGGNKLTLWLMRLTQFRLPVSLWSELWLQGEAWRRYKMDAGESRPQR